MRRADGANVDDHAAVTLCEILLAFLAHTVHEAKRIDAERFLQHFVGHVRDSGVVVHDTGIVNGNVQPSERLNRLFDHTDGCCRFADVACVPDKFAGQSFTFLRQLLEPLLAAGDRHDLRALAAE